MKATCLFTGHSFEISSAEEEFCRKNDIPFPVLSRRERFKEMLVFRNRPHLHTTTCGYSNKPIFSCIPPEKGFQVYDVEIWQSDKWDALQYGVDYDFSRPFFEQYYELLKRVPIPNLSVISGLSENSDYTNGITGAKNCYLVFGAAANEDCMFSKYINHCKDTLDCIMAYHCQLCYQCNDVTRCYNVKYATHCSDCSDSSFLFNCQSCRNCFGCVNLNSKEYHFYNEPLSKAAYEKKLKEINLGSYTSVQEESLKFSKFHSSFPIKFIHGKHNQNCTGNYVYNSKNCTDSYLVFESEDLENCLWIENGKSSLFHCMYGHGSELIYNSISCGDQSYNLKFCNDCWQSAHDMEYCMFCSYGAAHCFGCVGLKRKSYCIFNKQYSASEYHELVRRIKAHMRSTREFGRFFPGYISPFYYNQSDANDFFSDCKK